MQVYLDLENGTVTACAAPTCDFNGNGCADAHGWQVLGSADDERDNRMNQFLIEEDGDQIRVQIRALNSRRDDKGPIKIPSIDDVFLHFRR